MEKLLIYLPLLVTHTRTAYCTHTFTTAFTFPAEPREKLPDSFARDQVLKVASSYDTEMTGGDGRLKESIKEALMAILIEKRGTFC